jgi:hypothetical protein
MAGVVVLKGDAMKKIPVDELLRLACLYAEQDRESFIDATNGSDPEYAAEQAEFVRQLRAYRLKRWGKTQSEVMLEGCVSRNVAEVIAEYGLPRAADSEQP